MPAGGEHNMSHRTPGEKNRRKAFWRGWSWGLAVVALLELGEAAIWLAAGSIAWRPLLLALAAGLGSLCAARMAAAAEGPSATTRGGQNVHDT